MVVVVFIVIVIVVVAAAAAEFEVVIFYLRTNILFQTRKERIRYSESLSIIFVIKENGKIGDLKY